MKVIVNIVLTVLILTQLANCQDPQEISLSCDEENVKCYSLFRGSVTWSGAMAACQGMQRYLAVINNECSQGLIEKFSPVQQTDAGHAWMALQRSIDVTWRTIAGDPFSQSVTGSNDNEAFCAVMATSPNPTQVSFMARKCYDDFPRMALCQFPGAADDCLLGYYQGNTCYMIPNQSFWSQVDARQFCNEKFTNGTLGFVHLTSNALHAYAQSRGQTWYWVGVERRSWAWQRDGIATMPTFTRWRRYEGANRREGCMHAELKDGAKWADKACSLSSDYFICETGPGPQRTPFIFDDIFNGFYWPRGFFANFHSTGDYLLYRDASGHLVSGNLETNVTERIMDAQFLFDLSAWTYFVSYDFQYVLIAYERTRVYRDSFTARYTIFDRRNNRLQNFPNMAGIQNARLQYAQWSDGNTRLVFVYDNNVYFQSSPTASAVQVTTDGMDKYVINGVPDWMFEEDVLWSNKATYWSPTGRRLLFARFDLTGIPLVKIPVYGDASNMYPEVMEFALPKAGYETDGGAGATTKVELFVFDSNSPNNPPRKLMPPSELRNVDHYYTSVSWVNDNTVYVTWTNRLMSRSITTFCDVTSLTCFTNHDLVENNGWVFIPAPQPVFTDNGDNYVTILPREVAGSGRWRHLALVSRSFGTGTVTFLTDGEEEVTQVLGYDPEIRAVYYLSTRGHPTERHVLRVGTPSATAEFRPIMCMTCNLGTECLYNSASFSATGRFYDQECRGPGIPTYALIDAKMETSEVLEDNAFVRQKLEGKRLPRREFVVIPTANGNTAIGAVYYPPSYIPGRQYRMLQSVYSAPDSQEVIDSHPLGSYRTSWFTYLASALDVIVVEADGRGTYGRGDDYRFGVYRRLGRVDVIDQVAAGRFFKSQSYINASAPAAIIGWSYGGMISSLSLTFDNRTFQCGMAISPVTTKRYYDRAYSERYLGYSNISQAAYDGTDVMQKAARFKNKKFFIAHGTKDDNVQYQHAASLIQALTREGVQFTQESYIDEGHDLSSYYATQHLYKAMTDFLRNECWK